MGRRLGSASLHLFTRLAGDCTHLQNTLFEGRFARKGTILEHLVLNIAGIEPIVGDFAGVHLVQQGTQCKYIDGTIVALLEEEFRGHIDWRPTKLHASSVELSLLLGIVVT